MRLSLRWALRDRLVACVLGALVACFGASALVAQGAPSDGAGSGAPVLVGDSPAPEGAREVVGERTATSRSYVPDSGLPFKRVFARPVNFKNASGSWTAIDSRLERTEGGYSNTANAFDVNLPSAADGAFRVSAGVESVSFSLRGSSAASATVKRDAATYAGALDGVDLRLQSVSSGLKEDIVLANAQASRDLVFDVDVSDGLTPRLRADGSIDVVDAAGDKQFEIPAPTMADARGRASKAVAYELAKVEAGWRLAVVPSDAWLDATERAWPVAVDPSVYPTILDGGVDTYVDQNQPTTNYGSSTGLKVGYDTDGGSGHQHNALLKFDVRSLFTAWAKDVRIMHASLNLEPTSQVGGDYPVQAYAATRSWNPTQATWNKADSATNWTSAGGDFNSSYQSDTTPTVGNASGYQYFTWDVTSMTRDWVDGTITDHGVLLKTDGTSGKGFTFNSSESSVDPYMDIAYDRGTGLKPGYDYDWQRLSDRIQIGVHTGSGNLMVRQTDLQLRGGFGPSTTISRTYNSFENGARPAYGLGWSLDAGGEASVQNVSSHNAANDNSKYLTLPGGTVETLFVSSTDATNRYYTTPKGYDFKFYQRLSDGEQYLVDNESQTKLTFDSAGKLKTVTDRNSKTVTYGYGSGYLDTITDGRGKQTTLTQNGNGYFTSMTDPAGRSYGYGYTGSLMTSYTDPAGEVTSYGYDANGHLDEITTPDGLVTQIEYYVSPSPLENRVKSITRIDSAAADPKTTYDYAPDWTSTVGTVTDPIGTSTTGTAHDRETKHHFDSDMRQTKVTDALGRDRSTNYDGTTGKANEYFAPYNASSTASVSLSFDSTSNLVSGTTTQTGSGALTTSNQYGQSGSFGSGTPTGSQYLLTTTTDEQGKNTVINYDSAGNLTKVEGKDGSNVTVSSVEIGRNSTNKAKVEWTKDGNANQTDYAYNTEGDITSITPPSPLAAQTLDYSGASGDDLALGRVTSVRSGSNGRKATYTYDELDRVVQIDYSNGLTTSSSVSFDYSNDGDLFGRHDSATNTLGIKTGSTWYTYDDLHRLSYVDYPGSSFEYNQFDLASNLTYRQDQNGVTYYEYDDLNRLRKLREPGAGSTDADKVIYTWDEDSTKNNLEIDYPTSSDARNVLKFDKAGRMLETCLWVNPGSGSCNSSNAMQRFVYSYAQSSTQRALLQTETDKNGVISHHCYDDLGRLVRTEKATSTGDLPCGTDTDQTDWFGYTYDPAGNVLTRTRKSTTTETYAYNAANQLCWKLIGTSSNACSSVPSGAQTFSYDTDGNETAGPVRTASSYNDRNQLSSATVGGTATARKYRGPGQAELSDVGADELSYTMGGLGSYGTSEYVRDSEGSIVSQEIGGTKTYLIADQLGSTRALMSTSGTLSKQFSYDPYGRDLATPDAIGSSTTRLGYTGAMTDTVTGLIHNQARYYDPAILRWTQADPLNQPADLLQANRYGYVGGNPANWVDPGGTCILNIACDEQNAIIAGAAGVAAGSLIAAIPGVGPTAGVVAGGCVEQAVGSALDDKGSVERLFLRCLRGAGIGLVAGGAGYRIYKTVLPVLRRFT